MKSLPRNYSATKAHVIARRALEMELHGWETYCELELPRDASHRALILQDGLGVYGSVLQQSLPCDAAPMYEVLLSISIL